MSHLHSIFCWMKESVSRCKDTEKEIYKLFMIVPWIGRGRVHRKCLFVKLISKQSWTLVLTEANWLSISSLFSVFIKVGLVWQELLLVTDVLATWVESHSETREKLFVSGWCYM